MEGVTVINSWQQYSMRGGPASTIVLMALFGILAVILIVIAIKEKYLDVGLFALCCIATFTLGRILYRDIKTPTIQYEILLDDSVTFKEFNERYVLVEVHGNSYIVEEREDIYDNR